MRYTILMLIAASCSTPAQAALQYTVALLAPPQNASSAIPEGFSPSSIIGGSLSVDLNGTNIAEIATVWANQKANLLQTPPGYISSATRINETGDAIGAIRAPDANDAQPALWQGGQLQILPTASFPGGRAWDINNQGTIVGEVVDSSRAVSQAAIWNGGQLTLLNNFPAAQSWAPAINNRGQFLLAAAASDHPATWLVTSGVLTPITSPSGASVQGIALNDHGAVAGNTARFDSQSNGFPAGFFWKDGTFSILPDFPGDLTSSVLSMNDSDQIVGDGYRDSGIHALLWQNNQVYDLNSLIPAGSGWNLQEATAISDDGTIVGYGTLNGQLNGFELTPTVGPSAQVPEPATLLPLLTAAAALLLKRRR